MSSVAVIDYGMGNLRSVAKALSTVAPATQVWVTADAEKIRCADRIVFPGVGAMRDCMHELLQRDLVSVVSEVSSQKPFLGICLGMQLLMNRSEENGGTKALGIVEGENVRFQVDRQTQNDLKIPHMGWNQVHQMQAHPLWEGIAQDERFYFVHSYYVKTPHQDWIAAQTNYTLDFVSAVAKGNIFAVQFHPEKSQQAGLQLLKNFLHWDGQVA